MAEQTTIRIPISLFEKVTREANKKGITMNALINHDLSQYVHFDSHNHERV